MSGHLTVHGANVKSKPLVISDWGPQLSMESGHKESGCYNYSNGHGRDDLTYVKHDAVMRL